ncbi:sirohydrochlorin chelatase [Allobranchiibius sp. CTAmp26]|uniref:sirohydrochlorin chelatase n=1 Tax=Allobranchiibius sp. CTAmp26 TaxID=2815214 RepID=UPI001AA0B515|nr:CbiX/SirB N-terminal domain-containing protein [Allobranchiibius sp. CTAmp26]MBO1753881.1 sirohydrochlorin chelatase [Allobranchiibius sp. CTAmp26]
MPPLVLCAHGTANPAGQQVVLDLLAATRRELPGVRVEAAYVDVQQPGPGEVVAELYEASDPPVIVPLLLSTGYHVEVDIDRVVRAYPGTRATTALGPSPLLADTMVARCTQAGVEPWDAVVFAAAGSSRPQAARDAEQAAALFIERWAGSGDVLLGYGSASSPTIPEAVARLRAGGAQRVAIAAYLLGPGHFHDKLQQAGADLVTAPLGADERLVQQAIARYRSALSSSSSGGVRARAAGE